MQMAPTDPQTNCPGRVDAGTPTGPPEESCWVWPGTLIWGISADADWDLLLGLGDSGQRDFFLQSPEDARGLACPAGAGRRLQIPLPAENIETRHSE